MKITGKIEKILPVEVVGQNQTEKQSFIVTETGEHPNSLCLDVFGDRLSLLKDLNQGQEVTAHFNTKAREYDTKNGKRVFNGITAWKIETESPVATEDDSLPFN